MMQTCGSAASEIKLLMSLLLLLSCYLCRCCWQSADELLCELFQEAQIIYCLIDTEWWGPAVWALQEGRHTHAQGRVGAKTVCDVFNLPCMRSAMLLADLWHIVAANSTTSCLLKCQPRVGVSYGMQD